MTVAFVLITPWWRGSIDFDGLASALARQGHAPVLVCRRNDAGSANFPVVEATAAEYAEAGFWRGLGLDAAMVFSWLHEPALVRTLRGAGIRTALRADHDGMASVRVFPEATWRTTVASAQSLWNRLRCTRHWCRRWLRGHQQEDAVVMAAIEAADAVMIETQEAANNLIRIFDRYGRQDLECKLRVVPHSVHDAFLTADFEDGKRAPRIFCGGRWSDPQKDARLLSATLRQLLRREPDLHVSIAGDAPPDAFSEWAGHPRAQFLGKLPQEHLISLLGGSRMILSTSRWESHPIGSLEALCLGGGVVGPALPGMISLADSGRSGTLAATRSASALAEAASSELAVWSRGLRDPRAIARRWRSRVSNEAVAAGMIRVFEEGAA